MGGWVDNWKDNDNRLTREMSQSCKWEDKVQGDYREKGERDR